MITFGKDICQNFNRAVQKEWIETNGLGGYASSTVAGTNTRRYHGLLVASLNPPGARVVLLSKLEESIVIDGMQYDLSCNQYPNTIHPRGYKYLKEFRLSPFPKFIYQMGDVELVKTVLMIKGTNTTLINYEIIPNYQKDIVLRVRPMVCFREFHTLRIQSPSFNIDTEVYEGILELTSNENFPSLYLYHNGEFTESAYWYNNFEYQEDAFRGYECHEDLYSPGLFEHHADNGLIFVVTASTETFESIDVEEFCEAEITRRGRLFRGLKHKDSFVESLAATADSFITQKGAQDSQTIVAGYHWFGDWGRDAMISLPGLTLVTNRFNVAKNILKTYAEHCDQGMLPNRFSESGTEADYTAIDASLWFFYAVHKYLHYTNNYKFVKESLLEALSEIIYYYINGTRYGIHMDKDGLIVSSWKEGSLTWMDAKTDNLVVTPRKGKNIETNALWYNALKIMETISHNLRLKKEAAGYFRQANKTRRSFNKLFWNEKENCLYDYVDGNSFDDSVRPNQIMAVSLPCPLLPKAKQRMVVDKIHSELLTPMGLRTLSPNDKRYIGNYRGGLEARDKAYHQGTVWAWLLGPFITAYVKVYGTSYETLKTAAGFLAPLKQHLQDAGLNSISEIFDGDEPYYPRGCISQAWSVAEILRAYVEDILSHRKDIAKEPEVSLTKRI